MENLAYSPLVWIGLLAVCRGLAIVFREGVRARENWRHVALLCCVGCGILVLHKQSVVWAEKRQTAELPPAIASQARNLAQGR